LIQEEIKRGLNSGNACYHSVQNLSSFRLLPKNVKIRIYNIIILPMVLYGCQTSSLTLREEYSLRVFEKRVPRRLFGAKRDEVTGSLRKLHNEEFHNLYPPPSIIRMRNSKRMRWAGNIARIDEQSNAYRILMGNQEGKRRLRRPRHRWMDNIKMNL
jgi:hypothetical protein